MLKKALILKFLTFSLFCFSLHAAVLNGDQPAATGSLVKKWQRNTLISTEYGEISAVNISDGLRGRYHLQFITLEPNALFLPVLLHADMVFYVATGRGTLIYVEEDEMMRVVLRRGVVYRLQPGSVFFIQSDLEQERERLRVYAIFASSNDQFIFDPAVGVYSSIGDLVLGFDKQVLQAAFKVPEEVIDALTSTTKPPAIVHAVPMYKRSLWKWEALVLNALEGCRGHSMFGTDNKKKVKTYNIFEEKPDFKNPNGWSAIVTRKKLRVLKDSNIGVFMVNLTRASMMGPHWNPMASETAIVLQGQGMVRVVCSSSVNSSECRNMSFRAQEGDVFAVPRFHPMAQMSFNNDTFVFVGFSTTTEKNYPQFLAGKSTVLHALDRQVLAASFNSSESVVNQLLTQQVDTTVLGCISCAEKEEEKMKETKQKKEEEEKRKEEAKQKEKEEEEKRKREEAWKKEEERRQKEKEAKQKEEEKKQEEAARKKEEERRQKEGEGKQKEEETTEEGAGKKEEEKKQREEERKKEEEIWREGEEARKQEEERQKKEKQQQEETEKEKGSKETGTPEEEKEKREKEEAAAKGGEEERRKELRLKSTREKGRVVKVVAVEG